MRMIRAGGTLGDAGKKLPVPLRRKLPATGIRYKCKIGQCAQCFSEHCSCGCHGRTRVLTKQ